MRVKYETTPLNVSVAVTNLDTILKKAEELVNTLRKAKSQIDELTSLNMELEIKTPE